MQAAWFSISQRARHGTAKGSAQNDDDEVAVKTMRYNVAVGASGVFFSLFAFTAGHGTGQLLVDVPVPGNGIGNRCATFAAANVSAQLVTTSGLWSFSGAGCLEPAGDLNLGVVVVVGVPACLTNVIDFDWPTGRAPMANLGQWAAASCNCLERFTGKYGFIFQYSRWSLLLEVCSETPTI